MTTTEDSAKRQRRMRKGRRAHLLKPITGSCNV